MISAIAALTLSLCAPFCRELDDRPERDFFYDNAYPAPTVDPTPNDAPEVVGLNSAPVISGAPPTSVMVGEVYRFVPAAVDADGDRLTFSIRNKPSWAFFNTITGVLSGVAPQGSPGTYEGIEILVSDGKATASISAFPVTVVQTATGSITLTWQPPLQNEDGSTVTDLSGYRIHLGAAPGLYDRVLVVENPSITTYVVENLVPGTYYIAATAITTRGVESRKSNVIVRTIG